MSASLGVEFGLPVSDKYKKYAQVYKICREAHVEIPKDVVKFFHYKEPDGNALWLDEKDLSINKLVTDKSDYEKIINLEYLPKDIKLIKVTLDY